MQTVQADAKIMRIVVENKEKAYGGKLYGTVGAYEVFRGQAFGELDPKDPHNALVTDLALAPTNARGMVEYVATFTLSKPVNMGAANGVMIYCVPNRGNHISPDAYAVEGESGVDFLFKRGYTILHSGWQADVDPKPEAESIKVPVAYNPDGSSITGIVLARFSDMASGTTTLPLPSTRLAATLDTTRAVLTKRVSESEPPSRVPATDWAFGDSAQTTFPGRPDPQKITVKGGFDPGYLYELTYTAKDPSVMGIGFAATRDIVSYFRYPGQDQDEVARTVSAKIGHVIAVGISQSGNFIRGFLNLGFNQNEDNRIVWDGVDAHIAGRQVPLNFRFSRPGGTADLYEPGSEGVVWWGQYTDAARGRKPASLLDRCLATHTCPKVFETFGSTEFWGLRMSPDLVGTSADTDIPLPPNVRRYYFPGTAHGGGHGGFSTQMPTPANDCLLPENPNPQADTMRALLLALTDWVVKNAPPPPSAYPRLDKGELVEPDRASMGFPIIPGKPSPDGLINVLNDYDFGPSFIYNDMSGVMTIQPPIIKQALPSLVPKVDPDGNEIGGIPSAQH